VRPDPFFGRMLAAVCTSLAGCGGVSAAPQAPLSERAAATTATVPAGKADPPFAEPENLGPARYWVLGPFATATADDAERDYLAALGGEPEARLSAASAVAVGADTLRAREVASKSHIVDLIEAFRAPSGATAQPDLNNKVAYAYGEMQAPKAMQALILFGSDDGASVWVNGQRVHRIQSIRAVDPNSDRFEVPLLAGTNRILVKVDNGGGGWGFALRIFDEEGQRRIAEREARQDLEALEPGPYSDRFVLGEQAVAFPKVVLRNAEAARHVFGDAALDVRWFGPNLEQATKPAANGRYVALLAATTRDGYGYRRMLSFAKVPDNVVPWFPRPPGSESSPLLPLLENVRATAAERAELSRYVWHGGGNALERGEISAVAAARLFELKREPAAAPAEPGWLQSGFIKNLEHQLALRMKLEGRTPRPLAPPAKLATPAGALKPGTEAQAKMKPGTRARIAELAREWAKDDPSEFVVLAARKGVIFFHEAFNGFKKESAFYPASIAKSIAGLTFARAVDQGLLRFDQPLADVFPEWKTDKTAALTFRNCFNHVTGLKGHRSHDGLFNAYLDNAFLVQDLAFTEPGTVFHYSGDGFNLAGRALELVTGTSIFRLLHEHLQKPFEEPVVQLDLGAGDLYTAAYLAKVGQMLLQDGVYGGLRFYKPGFVRELWPRAIGASAPKLINKEIETGIGFTWMPDPPGDRHKGVLGPNVIGHGSGSGTMWRIAPDHDLVIVVGRNKHEDWNRNEQWSAKLAAVIAAGLPD